MIKGTNSVLLQVQDVEVDKVYKILSHLDKVFRFSNVPEVKKQNTVLEHINSALLRGNQILTESGYAANDELVRDFNRSMLVHDVGEILGEFKTEEDRRLGNDDKNLDRIEYKLAQVAIRYGIVVGEKFKPMLANLKKELAKGKLSAFEKLLDKFLSIKTPNESVDKWLKAYADAEGEGDNFLKRFVKLIDKLDGNKFILGNGINLPQDKIDYANKVVRDQLEKIEPFARNPKEKYLIGTVKEKFEE
jgi:hypothetical protein